MNSLIIATLQSCFSLPPLFSVGTNVKNSAETSRGTAAFWAIQCSAPTPTGTWIFSLINFFLPMFLFIFPFFCAAYSFIFISRFNLLSPSICCLCPLKEWFTQSRACSLLKSTGPVPQAEFCWHLSALDSHWEFRVPMTEFTINLLQCH